MAAIQNARDVLLQAAVVRIVPVPIPIEQVEGLPTALKSSRRLQIKASENSFIKDGATTTPATITLTAELLGGLTGTVTWSVSSGVGTITPSGNTCTVTGSTVTGASIGVQAQIIADTVTYQSIYIINKFGAISQSDKVDLVTQVTGKLANGNVDGLGALALLNTVNLNTQTTGALNGLTQVTNLGNLAYANAIAANQIGAGTLAAGVIYAGNINASQVTAGTFVGNSFRTSNTFPRVEIDAASNSLTVFNASGAGMCTIDPSDGQSVFRGSSSASSLVGINTSSGYGIEGSSASSSGVSGSTNASGHAGVLGSAISSTSFGIRGISYSSAIGVGGTSSSNFGGQFECAGGNKGAIRLVPVSALPSDKTSGAICFHTTHGFLFANGTNWQKPSGWTVVTS